MAALRLRKIRVITPEEARKYERWAKKGLKVGRPPKFAGKLSGKQVLLWEIVATTSQEAESGLFQPVGNLMVFIPEKVEDQLWQRIRTMDHPDHRDLWANKYWGIRIALKKLGMFIKHDVPQFPVGLLDVEKHIILPADIDPITKQVRRQEQMVKVRQYEAFINDKWLPDWLYGSRLARHGKFKTTRRAQAVATAFGIDIDTSARKESWYTTATPDILAEAEQGVIVDEDAYKDILQRMITTMESRLREGKPVDPDWGVMLTQFRLLFGAKTQAVIDRLRVDLEPILAQMKTGKWTYEENRSGAYRRAASN